MKKLEQAMGYVFSDQALLVKALTHRSLKADHNERLEFLGDAVLGMVMAHILFERYPEQAEGSLSQMRSQLVNREQLVLVAKKLSLPDCIEVGSGERHREGLRPSIIADALEALIGAVFLDGGLKAATDCIHAWFADYIATSAKPSAKCQLQQLAQANGWPLPTYTLDQCTGLAHHQSFEVSCRLEGYSAQGVGSTKREAEQNAALVVLQQIQDAS